MRLRTLLMLASLTIVVGLIGVTQAIAQNNTKQTEDTSTQKADTSAATADQNKGTPIEKADPSAAGAKGVSPAATTLSNATVIFAVVDSNGTLARGTGAVSAKRLDAGKYEVIFDRNVRTCGYTATIGLSGASGSSPPGEITTVGRVNNVNGVYVATYNSSGSPSSRGFHLQVAC